MIDRWQFAMVAVLVLAVWLLPLLLIWSLKTLFGLTIAYTLKTWAASLALLTLVTGGGAARRSS